MVDSGSNPKPDVTRATQTVVANLSYLEDVSRRDYLVFHHDRSDERSTPISKPTTIGSASKAGICVPDPTVSRLHCELRVRDGQLWIRDLQSKNGTWVNDLCVMEACVPEGARLRIGNSELRIGRESDERQIGLWPHERFGTMVGRSIEMRETFSLLHRFASTDAPLLILGETGTGKDEAARAVHTFSSRNRKPFVVLDCTTLSENLIASSLFGHTRGAFTGATADREGVFELAHQGTLFIDEVGELPTDLQAHLLRVLETGEVRRVGDNTLRNVDVRVVAATHRDLRTMVNAGTFREDLYFRLAVLEVRMPPLRERFEDLPLLWRELAPKGAAEPSTALLADLQKRNWSGNIRELRNYIGRFEAGFTQIHPSEPSAYDLPTPRTDVTFKELREQWTSHLEYTYFKKLLATSDHNISTAARAAGVSRTFLYEIIKKHGL